MKATALLMIAASATFAVAANSGPGLCPAVGSKDSQGREGCNPAVQYSDGHACTRSGDCYFLSKCVAPGRDDSIGHRSCDPQQQYPAGQVCAKVGGCYYLAQCDAAGQNNLQNAQNCELGRKYPDGNPCSLVSSGCYLISATSPKVESSTTTTTTTTSSRPSPSASCPAPGLPSSRGQVGCDPDKQYPRNQACRLDGGCYYLSILDKSDDSAGQRKVEKAGASPSCASSAAAFALALFLSSFQHICI
ncbi:hypothetical protein HIM_05604 [Hirsutella minnesotensis 3608]|uniref:Uncharacterized protein n=1 Tax=Hirsutella minnesotensis 3608 TaxID=1043627 RepID=A0A0F7ZUM4_9HYPO|nr:hypothetical protein HIM_05604 [Hirsutella minnesotensis 3608]